MTSSIPAKLKLVFSLSGQVDRSTYLIVGLTLSCVKYFVEAVLIGRITGQFYSPVDFLSPLLSHREKFTSDQTPWLGATLIIWTLPFIWISVAMSLRRCRDIGWSPWFSLSLLVPFVNFLAMFVLSIAASTQRRELPARVETPPVEFVSAEEMADLWKPSVLPQDPIVRPRERHDNAVLAGLAGIAAGVVYAFGSTVLMTTVFRSYGAAVFFGTPFIAGAVSGFVFNLGGRKGVLATIIQSVLMVGGATTTMLMFGVEGMICIGMALPMLCPIAVMGALIGRAIVVESPRPKQDSRGMMWCVAGLPLLAILEGHFHPKPVLSVKSSIEIAASPGTVWQTVIAFPDIETKPAWLFRTGIAYPARARIYGSGVGSVRHCEFSTGVFVEPITVWDEPHRLAFDVAEQPEPMFELTPWRHIHPPHLAGSFRSLRGEFRLEELPNGSTRLSGTTWYTLDIHPRGYWTLWTDYLLHKIHDRVLEHIKATVETM